MVGVDGVPSRSAANHAAGDHGNRLERWNLRDQDLSGWKELVMICSEQGVTGLGGCHLEVTLGKAAPEQ